MRWPSWIPAGISTVSVRSSMTRPPPWHSSQGVSIFRPEPAQSGHACVRTNSPNTLRVTCCSRPAPPHVGHVEISDAGLRAAPAAVRARDRDLERDVARDAVRRVDEVDLDGGGEVGSAPAPRPAAESDVVAEERGEEVGEIAEVDVTRLEAAAAQAGVAVAVVQRARLALREHLVGLDDFLEALLGVRRVGDVGMELAREPSERLLDLGLVGAARDAEQLVVVAVGRRHQASS